MLDIAKIAARLDADEKFAIKYRFPVRTADGQVNHEIRQARVLDVAEDAGLLYVSYEGEIIWVKMEEVVELVAEAG